MSRYYEYDCDYENANLDQGRWRWNIRQALKGRKGRQALRDLRDALMALPDHRLIEGAVCTVGSAERRAGYEEAALKRWEATPPQWRADGPTSVEANELGSLVDCDGEGVCAVGALLWHRAVKAGADPAEAFAGLPDVSGESDGLESTALLANHQARVAFTLAWHLAWLNDEKFQDITPEERWQAFMDWIDAELGENSPAEAS